MKNNKTIPITIGILLIVIAAITSHLIKKDTYGNVIGQLIAGDEEIAEVYIRHVNKNSDAEIEMTLKDKNDIDTFTKQPH